MPDRFLQDVITNLRFHTAWIEIGAYFQRNRPDGKDSAFIRRMMQVEQSIIHRLSRTLRQHDYAPSRIQPDSTLIEQAKKRQTPETVLRYIHHGILMSLEWYQERLKMPDHPFRALWQELFDEQSQLKMEIEQVLGIKASHSE